MMRTQISLDPREYELAKREAKSRGISIAEFVRQAVRDKLPVSGKAPWMRYAGLVESGNPGVQPVYRRAGLWRERLSATSILRR